MPVLRRPKWSLLSLLRHHPVNEREKKESLVGARSVCLVIPTCISLFYECLASLLSQFFAMPKAHFSFGCISSQCQKVAPARFVLHGSVCSIFFLQLSQFIKYSRESVLQLFDRASLFYNDEARDLCRVHSLSGYNSTWSLPPIRARIKEKKIVPCALSIEP